MESSGQFLITKIKFGVYLLMLLLLYITNRIHGDRLLATTARESAKLRSLALEYQYLKSRLTFSTSKEEMVKKAYKYGLREPTEAPLKISIRARK